MYPINLNLKGKRCLVVGGGGVALRKIEGLLQAEADVTAVAPLADEKIRALFADGTISLHVRPYAPDEALNFDLVFAATDDRAINQQVFDDATRGGIWVNVADDPMLCSFHLPAKVERGALQIAVGSGGGAPFAVRRIRRLLERRMGPEWAEWMEAASRFRKSVRDSSLSPDDKERLFDVFFDATVDDGTLCARIPSAAEQAAWIAAARQMSAPSDRPIPTDGRRPAESTGFVSLVGGGPGDPGLLTVKGHACLMRADAVVCDRLAQTVLPCELKATTSIHFVGKTAGNHPTPQEEINAMLIRLASEGKRVVRLKGGDPYVFGRGGEEALALAEACIPFEVVPGVTAATAVPAYAGIPLTFRKEAVRVTLITAHEAIKSDGPQVRWDLLAKDPNAAILGYMGVTNLEHTMQSLMDNGMDPKTPAALIERGTTSKQRAVYGTVSDLYQKSIDAKLGPPALFVVGPTAGHAEELDWFGKRTLLGERLVSFEKRSDIVDALTAQGAEWVALPNPVTEAARLVMDALPVTGAVFFTADEVDFMEEERARRSWVKQPVAWCLTPEAVGRAQTLAWHRVCAVNGGAAELFDAIRLDAFRHR
jgi:uroporphyrin-III C-methyltransferase/precorrin-2 dehydrogenase/sirohydrochlorin ferrochelatase